MLVNRFQFEFEFKFELGVVESGVGLIFGVGASLDFCMCRHIALSSI